MVKRKINNDSFEYYYNKLQLIVEKLEGEIEDISLDDIINNYQEGLKLLKICRDKIKHAELKIEKINKELT